MTTVITTRELATLAGGCFWCLEAVFEQLQGVDKVVSGYAGGHVPNPTYEQVCTKTTGHAEVVQVTFDPQVVPFADLLDVFFATHDPTTLNRQGNDAGPQYRSAIFYHSEAQRAAAEAKIRELTAQPFSTRQSSPKSCRSRSSTPRRTTTRATSARTRSSRTAPRWSRPRWRSSARSSRTG